MGAPRDTLSARAHMAHIRNACRITAAFVCQVIEISACAIWIQLQTRSPRDRVSQTGKHPSRGSDKQAFSKEDHRVLSVAASPNRNHDQMLKISLLVHSDIDLYVSARIIHKCLLAFNGCYRAVPSPGLRWLQILTFRGQLRDKHLYLTPRETFACII